MAEMIDKVFSTKLAEQMTGFYGKQKMLRKLNNKLEMNNQQQKVVELDDLVRSYAAKAALSEDPDYYQGIYDDCEEGVDCPLFGDEVVLGRLEEVLADAYAVQEEQGEFDPWVGSRDHLEFHSERDYQHQAELAQELLREQYEEELEEKRQQVLEAKSAAERSEANRQLAELEIAEYEEALHRRKASDALKRELDAQVALELRKRELANPTNHHHPQSTTSIHASQFPTNIDIDLIKHQQASPSSHFSSPYDHLTQQPITHHQTFPNPVPQHPIPQTNPYMQPQIHQQHQFAQPTLPQTYFAQQQNYPSTLPQQAYQNQMLPAANQNELLIPVRENPLSMKPHEAADYSTYMTEEWMDSFTDAQDEAQAAYVDQIRAAYHADNWERQKAEKQAKRLAAAKEEAHAAQQAQKWKSRQKNSYERLTEAEQLEELAWQQAEMWALTENEMREREEDLKFDRLRHSLGNDRDFADLRRARGRKTSQSSYQYHAPQIDYEYDEYLDPSPASSSLASSTKVNLRKKGGSQYSSSSQQDEYRWYDPQWSIIGAITTSRSIAGPHQSASHSDHWRAQNEVDFMDDYSSSHGSLPIQTTAMHSKIIANSIFCCAVSLFGSYIVYKVMLPQSRFERNSNLVVFYMASFAFLLLSLVPSGDDQILIGRTARVHHHHAHEHQNVVAVCSEVFRFSVTILHLASTTNVFLLAVARKFIDNSSVQKWTQTAREINSVVTFVALAFLIPLRVDFEWYLQTPFPYLLAAILILGSRPDSKVDLALNVAIFVLMYFQLSAAAIFATFILNFKVFHYGYKKTRYVQSGENKDTRNSIQWAKKEFQDATSYLNSTLECPTEFDNVVADKRLQKEIRSFGILSIKEERIEYVGGSVDTSFILYDASQSKNTSSPPVIHTTSLKKPTHINDDDFGEDQEQKPYSNLLMGEILTDDGKWQQNEPLQRGDAIDKDYQMNNHRENQGKPRDSLLYEGKKSMEKQITTTFVSKMYGNDSNRASKDSSNMLIQQSPTLDLIGPNGQKYDHLEDNEKPYFDSILQTTFENSAAIQNRRSGQSNTQREERRTSAPRQLSRSPQRQIQRSRSPSVEPERQFVQTSSLIQSNDRRKVTHQDTFGAEDFRSGRTPSRSRSRNHTPPANQRDTKTRRSGPDSPEFSGSRRAQSPIVEKDDFSRNRSPAYDQRKNPFGNSDRIGQKKPLYENHQRESSQSGNQDRDPYSLSNKKSFNQRREQSYQSDSDSNDADFQSM